VNGRSKLRDALLGLSANLLALTVDVYEFVTAESPETVADWLPGDT
jgi:hypothetical protein